MKDFEIYHVTNEPIKNSEIYQKILEKQSYSSLSILIDNYNFNHSIKIIPEDLLNKFNVIGFEKSFADICSELLSSSRLETDEFANQLIPGTKIKVKRKDGRFTCAMLTCSWYLCRLNIIPFPKDTILNKPICVSHITNVLDEKYRKNEQNVMKIIDFLFPNSSISNNISHIFYNEKGEFREGL